MHEPEEQSNQYSAQDIFEDIGMRICVYLLKFHARWLQRVYVDSMSETDQAKFSTYWR